MAKFSREHYHLIASALRNAYLDSNPDSVTGVMEAAEAIANELEKDNPSKFDRVRFILAVREGV